MSSLTECNFCTVTWMRGQAAMRGVELILTPDDRGWISARFSDESEPAAYFKELSDECAC